MHQTRLSRGDTAGGGPHVGHWDRIRLNNEGFQRRNCHRKGDAGVVVPMIEFVAGSVVFPRNSRWYCRQLLRRTEQMHLIPVLGRVRGLWILM